MTAIAEPDTTVAAEPAPAAAPPEAEAKPRDILIICYSGELEKTWAAMILATTGAAMGAKVRVFLTFWGLQTFVKDDEADHRRRLDAEDDVLHAAPGHLPPQALAR